MNIIENNIFLLRKTKNRPVQLNLAVEMDDKDVPNYKELLARSKKKYRISGIQPAKTQFSMYQQSLAEIAIWWSLTLREIPGCSCNCVCSPSSAIKHINGFNHGVDVNASVGYASEKGKDICMLQLYLSDEKW